MAGGALAWCLDSVTKISTPNLSLFLWSVADPLLGDSKQSDDGKVVLHFTVLRRVDCVLEEIKDAVLKGMLQPVGLRDTENVPLSEEIEAYFKT